MFSLEQLKAQIGAYSSGKVSLGDFEDWFYEHSLEPLGPDVDKIVSDVDAALSGVHFGHRSQAKLRSKLQELAKTARPFASALVEVVIVRSGEEMRKAMRSPVRLERTIFEARSAVKSELPFPNQNGTSSSWVPHRNQELVEA